MKNNIIKEMLNNIEVNKKLDDKILSKTIYKKTNLLLQKSIITISIIILIGFTGFGLVHASEIIEKIKGVLFVKNSIEIYPDVEGTEIYMFVDNKKELNYDAKFESIEFPLNDNQHEIAIEEVEKELKINFLTSDVFKDNKIARIIQLEKNNDKISRGFFVIDNIYKNKSEQISISMEFITKYYDEDELRIMVGINHKNDYSLEEKNDILNVELYFWGTYDYINKEKGIGSLRVSFIYDDVVYTLTGTNTSKAKLLEIINSLHY